MTDGKPKREQPWAIRGVENETKAAATLAASRAGVTLGKWLDRVVRDAVAEQLSTKGRQEIGPTQAEIMAQVAEALAKVNQRLDQVEQQQQPKPEKHQQPLGFRERVSVLLTGKPKGAA